MSPEDLRPYPKAELRKNGRKRRRTGKTQILTDTPEKDEVAHLKAIRMEKLSKRGGIGKKTVPAQRRLPIHDMSLKILMTTTSKQQKKAPSKKTSNPNSKIVIESDNHRSVDTSTSQSDDQASSTSESDDEVDLSLHVKDYILIMVHTTKHTQRYYIAQVGVFPCSDYLFSFSLTLTYSFLLKVVARGFEVKWFKRIQSTNKFTPLPKEEENFVPTINVLKKMDPPFQPASSSRYVGLYSSSLTTNFHSHYNNLEEIKVVIRSSLLAHIRTQVLNFYLPTLRHFDN